MKKKIAVVTGGAGFIGSHMVDVVALYQLARPAVKTKQSPYAVLSRLDFLFIFGLFHSIGDKPICSDVHHIHLCIEVQGLLASAV